MNGIMKGALCALVCLGLAGCSSAKPADGTYTARVDEATAEAAHGWTDTLTVTFQDGKVTSADFDAFDTDGNRKSELTQEEYPMDPSPADWMPTLEENVKATADPDKVAAVAGATQSSNNAKELYRAIREAAEKGSNSKDLTVTVSKDK